MKVYAKHDIERNVHIITSIDGDTVRSISYYNTEKGRVTLKDWTHRLDELGWKSEDMFVNNLLAKQFKEVPWDESYRKDSGRSVAAV